MDGALPAGPTIQEKGVTAAPAETGSEDGQHHGPNLPGASLWGLVLSPQQLAQQVAPSLLKDDITGTEGHRDSQATGKIPANPHKEREERNFLKQPGIFRPLGSPELFLTLLSQWFCLISTAKPTLHRAGGWAGAATRCPTLPAVLSLS